MIVALTDAFAHATMTKREEIVGRSLFDVFPDNPAESQADGTRNLRASLELVLKTGVEDIMAIQKYDIRRPEAEGGAFEERYWSPVNSPLRGANGQTLFLINRVEDVTAFIHLKQREASQQQINEGLRTRTERIEAESYVRGQQLQDIKRQLRAVNEERQQLYERLQRLEQLKAQFFSNVSQEFRTPLSLILGPAEKLLARGELSALQSDDVKLIQRNANALLRHVNELLDVANLDVGKMTAQYTNVDLAELTRRTAGYFESFAREYGFFYAIETPRLLAAQVDEEKIQQILVNLIANAFSFVPARGRVQCVLTASDTQAELIISDNGPGIPQEQRTSLFDRFYQADESSTHRFKGAGLGLLVAKDFVDLHGGTIHVSDAAEGGLRMMVTLPLVAPTDVSLCVSLGSAGGMTPDVVRETLERLRSQLPLPDAHKVVLDGDRKLVLVVEDNGEMSRYLCAVLGQEYCTEIALDGEEGLRKAIQLRPDLIVSDMMMPRLSGLQLLQELRARPEIATIPLIMMTGKTDDDLRMRLLREGVQDYLVKPFSKEELLVRVRNVIERRRAEDALRQAKEETDVVNRELESFSYSVAHDLRAPLRGINGFGQALAEDYGPQLDEEGRGYIERIRAATQRMGHLIDALLELSRMTRAEIRREWVDLPRLAAAIIDRYRVEQPERAVLFVSHEGSPVLGDPQLLAALLENLLGNAWKFTSQRPQARIEFSVTRQDAMLVYSVGDDGAGFDMTYAEKLFAPFQRLHVATEFAGTGVGLATVQRIAARHGGRVWAQGSVGQGATFSFTLPYFAIGALQ